MLFAQQLVGGGTDVTAWLQVLMQAGAFGLLVYIVVVAFPRYQKENKDERTEQRQEFLKSLVAQNVAFEARVSETTRAVEAQTAQFKEAIKEQTKDFADAFGSDPKGLCKITEALKEGGFCQIKDVEKYAEIIARMREKYGDGKPSS